MTAIEALALSVLWMIFLLARDQRFIWRADQQARNAKKEYEDRDAAYQNRIREHDQLMQRAVTATEKCAESETVVKEVA